MYDERVKRRFVDWIWKHQLTQHDLAPGCGRGGTSLVAAVAAAEHKMRAHAAVSPKTNGVSRKTSWRRA